MLGSIPREPAAARENPAGGDASVVMLPDAGHSAPVLGLYDPRRAPAVLPAILGFVRGGDPNRGAAVAPGTR